MSFIEVERSVRPGSWTMQGLHAHPHYEIYYLYQGSRQLLLANALYHMEAPSWRLSRRGRPQNRGRPLCPVQYQCQPRLCKPLPAGGPPGLGPGCGPPLPEEHSAMFPLLEDLERCSPGSRHAAM